MKAAERVCKYLDLSTGHLTEAEREGPAIIDNFKAIDHGYGWRVWVPAADDPHLAENAAQFPNVLAAMNLARSLDCFWINFDADGEYVDELPVFDDEAAEFDALLEERGVISPGPRKEST